MSAREAILKAAQESVGGCREQVGHGNCWAPAEYVLWGKLLPPEAFGPRCYDHAAEHVGHRALGPQSGFALVNLAHLAERVESAIPTPSTEADHTLADPGVPGSGTSPSNSDPQSLADHLRALRPGESVRAVGPNDKGWTCFVRDGQGVGAIGTSIADAQQRLDAVLGQYAALRVSSLHEDRKGE